MTEKAETYGLQSNQWLKAVHLSFSDTLKWRNPKIIYEAHSVPKLSLQHRVNQFYTIYFSALCVLKCVCQSKTSCQLKCFVLFCFVLFGIKVVTPEIRFNIFTGTIHRAKKKYVNGDEKHQNLVEGLTFLWTKASRNVMWNDFSDIGYNASWGVEKTKIILRWVFHIYF